MGFVFISYSSKDREDAEALQNILKNSGIKTWMAPEDIPAGATYSAAIIEAIRECSCVLLLLTENAQGSRWVPKEVERAISYGKPVLPVQTEAVILNSEFELYISTAQCLGLQKICADSKEIKSLLTILTAYAGRNKSVTPIKEYRFPPVSLLASDAKKARRGDGAGLLEAQTHKQKLTEVLAEFNVNIRAVNYSRGPAVTYYELWLAPGIKARNVVNLADDIALALGVEGVRVALSEQKDSVTVEIPNRVRERVFLRSLIDSDKFREEKGGLIACLGVDATGDAVYFDIAKLPHLLIAGMPGTGKSVCINSIIVSLLYKAKPDEVKLILIDQKKVEFHAYKDIPHLYCPVINDLARAVGALAATVAEMERRLNLLEAKELRNIADYNRITKQKRIPRLVVIIDDLADLMLVDDTMYISICRLVQRGRAAGIHIIIGTRSVSSNVITGRIKANIPSRIAFTMASQVDSRTIIDIAGAERLIGRGDMLYSPVGVFSPRRVQGSFVSEGEVEKIVEFVKAENKAAEYNTDFIKRVEEEAAEFSRNEKGNVSPIDTEDAFDN